MRRRVRFRSNKIYKVVGVILLFFTMTIGYAYLERQLNGSININVAKYVKKITVQDLIAKANPAGATYAGVSDAQKKEMFAFDHTSPTTTTDYRYIGNTPNNYITFNNEEWRIIGVFDGKIKIIRSLGIDSTDVSNPTYMSWDYKKSGLGSSDSDWGSNDWSDAQLMYLLNRQYVDGLLKSGYTKIGNLIRDVNGNVIYRMGYHPASQLNNQSTYSGTTTTSWTGLTDIAKNQVAEVIWNLGVISSYSANVDKYYAQERGTVGYNNSRPTEWIGRIGLMYASDYGYTFGKGVDNTCFSNLNECWKGTPSSSWLYIKNKYQWTISISSVCSNCTMSIYDARSDFSGVHNIYGVRPCVYLKSDIKLQGSGSSGDPYKIVN